MSRLEKCPVCGGDLRAKDVQEVLHGGKHAAILKVHVEVCLKCGERLYTPDTVRRFEEIRAKLERQDTSGFAPLGQTFQVA